MSVSEAVPAPIRRLVVERDNHCCRICGQWVDVPGLHHITYRSAGGDDVPENLIVVGWTPGHDCHLPIAHGPEARLWRPILQVCTSRPELTAMAIRRALGSSPPRLALPVGRPRRVL